MVIEIILNLIGAAIFIFVFWALVNAQSKNCKLKNELHKKDAIIAQLEKEQVSKQWFQTLYNHALDFDEAQKKWDYSASTTNNLVFIKAMCLYGYAKSAKYIIQQF